MNLWNMTLTKADLVEATDGARQIATWRKRRADRQAFPLVIAAGDDGLSFRSADAALDVPATGTWPSPIRVAGAVLHSLAPKLAGPDVTLVYADGQLVIGTTVFSATEV